MSRAAKLIFSSFLLISFLCLSLCLATVTATYYSLPNCADLTSNPNGLPFYSFLTKIRSHDVVALGDMQLKTGQTYIVQGDGRWYGSATLLFINKSAAVFFVEYPGEETSNQCIWHALKKNYSGQLKFQFMYL
jgi:hypothetical protein